MASLPETFNKIVSFLNKEQYAYLIIGGMAAGILGAPRMTQDIDFCIFISDEEIKEFLSKANKAGFDFNEKETRKRIKETGAFKISYRECNVDFLIVSTDFEKEALARKQKINLYGIDAYFPTPEDLILFKVVPARHIDMSDIEKIIERHLGKLDKKYIMKWAQKLSDEAENMQIYNTLKKLLKTS